MLRPSDDATLAEVNDLVAAFRQIGVAGGHGALIEEQSDDLFRGRWVGAAGRLVGEYSVGVGWSVHAPSRRVAVVARRAAVARAFTLPASPTVASSSPPFAYGSKVLRDASATLPKSEYGHFGHGG